MRCHSSELWTQPDPEVDELSPTRDDAMSPNGSVGRNRSMAQTPVPGRVSIDGEKKGKLVQFCTSTCRLVMAVDPPSLGLCEDALAQRASMTCECAVNLAGQPAQTWCTGQVEPVGKAASRTQVGIERQTGRESQKAGG